MVISPTTGFYNDENKLIFLAGPTIGSNSWQDTAISFFQKEAPEVTIADPRFNGEPTRTNLIASLEWSIAHIRLASIYGAVMFWLSPPTQNNNHNAYAQKDMFEFAEWLTHYKYRKIHDPDRKLHLILGIDDNFPERDYVIYRVFDDCPEFTIASSVEETCRMCLESLK